MEIYEWMNSGVEENVRALVHTNALPFKIEILQYIQLVSITLARLCLQYFNALQSQDGHT